MKNRKGFTLIELLAVILILGIIALIAIPTVNGVIEQSRKGAAESTGNEMVKGAEQYHTICLMNGMQESECQTKLTEAKADENSLKTLIGIKGDIPDTIQAFLYTSSGEILVSYEQGSFKCSNIKNGNDIVYRANDESVVLVAENEGDSVDTINPDGVKCEKK